MWSEFVVIDSQPNWTDEWMVWVTLASVVSSFVVAGLAFWNGLEARKIADSAARREEKFRADEVEHRAGERRAEIALALSTAISAEDYRIDMVASKSDRAAHSKIVANQALLDALAKLSLVLEMDPNGKIRPWLIMTCKAMRSVGISKEGWRPEVNRLRDQALRWVARWNSGEATVDDLPEPDPEQ